MRDSESLATLYRRRARACLEIARTSFGEKRIILIDLAQSWFRLAEEQEASMPPTVEGSHAVVQQQQKIQPKDDDKEG